MTPEDIERREFRQIWRGADPVEVQAFLRQIAQAWRERSQPRSDPIAELSTEVGSVLQAAHDSAASIVAQGRW